MITSSSISYVSQMLEEPQNLNDADAESIRQLNETYPYFVPARYMQAALTHKLEPFKPEMMTSMQLYSGNWLLYSEYLQEALGGEKAEYVAAAVETPKKAPATQPPIDEDELPEEEEITEEPVAEEPQAAAPLAEEVIATQAEAETITIPEDDFVPQNTGFIRGRKAETPPPTPVMETPIAAPVKEKEEIIETAPEAAEAPNKEKYVPQPERNERSENLIPPIYTEDYFLHQGMHVSNDIPAGMSKQGGNLSTQEEEKSLMVVMSFAEWLSFYKKKRQQEEEVVQDQRELKTMWQKEKLAAALEEENDEIPENVFEMAVNSITKEENLVSESLAEVMVKQGRYDRAIDMYKKLSLRKPQKKAYFARKIEEILKEK